MTKLEEAIRFAEKIIFVYEDDPVIRGVVTQFLSADTVIQMKSLDSFMNKVNNLIQALHEMHCGIKYSDNITFYNLMKLCYL